MKLKLEQLQHSMAACQRDLQAVESLNEECSIGVIATMSTDLSKLESSVQYDSDEDYSPMKNIENNREELEEDEADKQRRLSSSPLAHRVYRRASRSRSPKPFQNSDIDTANAIYESGKKRSFSGTQFASPDDVASPKRPYGSQLSGVTKELMTPWPRALSTDSPSSDKQQRGQNEGRDLGGQNEGQGRAGFTWLKGSSVDECTLRDKIGSEFTVTQTGLSDSGSDSGAEEVLDSGGGGGGGVEDKGGGDKGGGRMRVEENHEVVEDVIELLMIDTGDDIDRDGAKSDKAHEGEGGGCIDVVCEEDWSSVKEDAMREGKPLSADSDIGLEGEGEGEEGQKSKDDLSESIDVNGQNRDEDLIPEGGKCNVGNAVATSEKAAESDRQTRASGSSPSSISPKSSQPADPSQTGGHNITPSSGAYSGIPAKIPPIDFSPSRLNIPHRGFEVEASGGNGKSSDISAEMSMSSIPSKRSKSFSQNDRDSAQERNGDERSENDRKCSDLSSSTRRNAHASPEKKGEREEGGADSRDKAKGENGAPSGSDNEQDEAGEVDEIVESSSSEEFKNPTRNAFKCLTEGGDSQTAIAQDRPIEETFDTQAAYHHT